MLNITKRKLIEIQININKEDIKTLKFELNQIDTSKGYVEYNLISDQELNLISINNRLYNLLYNL